MAVERTFSIIKPDATRRNLTGKINARFEDKGLRIVAQKRIWMPRLQAEQFYGVHKARPFFNDIGGENRRPTNDTELRARQGAQ